MTASDMKTTSDESVADKAARVSTDIKNAGKAAFGEAQSKVTEAVSGVAAQAGDRLENTKNQVADKGDQIAESLREVASRGEDGSMQAKVLETVASGLTSVTDTLRGADASEMIAGVQRFAQRNPVLFATGAAVAGLLVARALAGPRHGRVDVADRAVAQDDVSGTHGSRNMNSMVGVES